MCVQPNGYNLFVAHRKYISVHLGFGSAYDLYNFLFVIGKKLTQ